MGYYEPIKVRIDAPDFIKIIIDIVIRYYGLLDSIITNSGFFFYSKFWSSLSYFFNIKKKLLMAFYL